MSVTFRIEFFGEAQVSRTLDRFAGDDVDLSPAWGRITTLFLNSERRQFASQGAFGSGGWAPLSPQYAAWKRAHYPGKTILRRTDELYRSLTSGPQIRIQTPKRLTLGSAVSHGVWHTKGAGRLPRRRPVELPESVRREMVKLIHEAIIRAGGR